jgi:hypothetical protein
MGGTTDTSSMRKKLLASLTPVQQAIDDRVALKTERTLAGYPRCRSDLFHLGEDGRKALAESLGLFEDLRYKSLFLRSSPDTQVISLVCQLRARGWKVT